MAAASRRAARAHFDDTIRRYSETRQRIRQGLETLAATWPSAWLDSRDDGAAKRIVFYGAGEVAEIGYICLQHTDLRLVGVVDGPGRGTFFGYPVRGVEQLRPTDLDGKPFDCLVMTTVRRLSQIRARLEALAIPLERVYWLVGDGWDVDNL